MSFAHDPLIAELSDCLEAVPPAARPWRRSLAWLGIIVAVALVTALFTHPAEMVSRFRGAPDLLVAALGSLITAILAGIAAFQLNLPDRRWTWVFLPVPSLVVWMAASGLGCMRSWTVGGTHAATAAQSGDCLTFIIAFSVPLSIVLVVLLRQGFSLRPNLTLLMGGLAAASASATLLNLAHPFDASVSDLAMHFIAVALVIAVNEFVTRRAIARV